MRTPAAGAARAPGPRPAVGPATGSRWSAYVSNMPFDADEAQLLACCVEALGGDPAAVRSATIARSREDGRACGFGFVELASETALVSLLQRSALELSGRVLRVASRGRATSLPGQTGPRREGSFGGRRRARKPL
ncbi:hypothetical protein T492DRAFT_983595 [Pavlovales sp. CCMP2436]|nr:hypothetical protein T492DRAFT_983595 [Pavlovales sp. CCMP2436]